MALPWSKSLEWEQVQGSARLFQAECGGAGDCLFACLAAWMNLAEGRCRYTPGAMRHLAVSALDEPTADFVRAEAQCYREIEENVSFQELQARMCQSAFWGNHSFLFLWLRAIRRVYGISLQVIVLVDTASRFSRVLDDEATAPRYALCLHCIGERHYKLLGTRCSLSQRMQVVFDMAKEDFI